MSRQNLNNGESYGIHRGKINANFIELYSIKLESSQVLTKTNTIVFTPTLNYHPATKLYADQLRTNWDNVFNPQNINADIFLRGNHTGTQPPSTIETDESNRFISDAERAFWNQKENAIGSKGNAFNKNFGTSGGTVAEGNHTHNKADIGLGNVDDTSDVNKPISTAQQSALDLKADITELDLKANITDTQDALDLKQDSSSLQSDINTIVETAEVHFSKYRDTKAVIDDYNILLSDDTLIVAATTKNITITLPLYSSLVGLPYQIIEIIPIVANGFKVRIETQGSDTFPFGNTWFDLPFSQKQFAIGLHEHGFNLRRNLSIGILVQRTSIWSSANFDEPTGIPWDIEARNNQSQLIQWNDTENPERIYIYTTGTYSISGGVNLAPQAVQAWEVTAHIYIDGIAVDYMTLTTGGEGNNKASLFGSGIIDLTAGQYVEMTLEHSLTAAVNVTSARFSLGIRL